MLDGKGSLRIGDKTLDIAAGDYITFPAGPDSAHRIDNTGDGPLRYLCMSSRAVADVVGYPDSDKIAAMANPNSNFFDAPWVRAIFKAESQVGYYEGEQTD